MQKVRPGSKLVRTLFIGMWTVKVLYLLKKGPQRHGSRSPGFCKKISSED